MANTDFLPLEYFQPAISSYSLLPFRFDRRTDGSYLLVNEVGEFQLLTSNEFYELVEHKLLTNSPIYNRLKSKHFVCDASSSALFDVYASKYLTKKSFLKGSAKLHIFVTTLRCNQACQYCQVTRQNESAESFDMNLEVMRRSVDLMMVNPSPFITMEFQGGEPLLNFDVLKEGVIYAKNLNEKIGKHIEFVVCTNLTLLKDEHLDFFSKYNVQISSSLDGPDYVHDYNRHINGGGSHKIVIRNIHRAQEALGSDSVSCLMTTTRMSLKYPHEIIDEYLKIGMRSIFIRDLNPYGYAVKTRSAIGYSTEEFIKFYKTILDYIIELNRNGHTFPEAYASLILQKILTPWPIGFVDLQSPSGAGFGVVVYNYDGDVYVSDEARMLAEMGQQTFRMGNVIEDTYNDIFFGETMQLIASAACNEALPGCADCAYQTYCGADPVRNFATQGDIVGHRPTSTLCKKNMAMIKYIFDLLINADKSLEQIFWAWINRESIERMQLPRPTWLLK